MKENGYMKGSYQGKPYLAVQVDEGGHGYGIVPCDQIKAKPIWIRKEEFKEFIPVPAQVETYKSVAEQIGALVDEKNKAYGDSFNKCGEFLSMLYPNGIEKEQYTDMLGLVRVFDKMMRIANQKDAFGENPWSDIVGYGILRSKG